MKNTGVWLDKKRAVIVTIENEIEIIKTIHSDLDSYNVTSNKHIGGPQEIVQDIKYLEREKNQLKAYYKDIIQQIKTSDALVLFGPAETSGKFAKELDENYKGISIKVKAVRKVDSMTDNQIKAWVKDFFQSNL